MAPVPQLEPNEFTPFLDPNASYGDFRDDLASQGWVVVPGVLSKDKCDAYIDRMLGWIESFGLGYKRDDPSTWTLDNLPVNHRGGLYNQYGVAHEQFLWDLRSEPELVQPFEKLWGTDELLVGFDGCNISIPGLVDQRKDIGQAWPHVDQSPLRKHFHCAQGIINLNENGPLDGGLMVLKGSRQYYTEMFEVFAKDMPEGGWQIRDGHTFTDEQMAWLESRPNVQGWHKVCAGPGDLILWDSRTCHYGAPTRSNNLRVAAYVCYKPARLITPEYLEIKLKMFEEMQNTTHDGTLPFGVRRVKPHRIGSDFDPAWLVRQVPEKRPVLTPKARKMAGLEPY